MALNEGADIINDVSALRDDSEMVLVARDSGAPVVLMHRQGTPRDMQINPTYDDVCREVYQFLGGRLRELEAAGLDPEQMVIDPGIGFGKRVEHNLALLSDLDELRSLGRPVLVGASRKSFMGNIRRGPVNPPDGEGTIPQGLPPRPPGGGSREVSTLAAHAAAIAAGAAAVRVHDVSLHRDLVRIFWAIARGSRPAGE
jgi:dihydropteroate synthase